MRTHGLRLLFVAWTLLGGLASQAPRLHAADAGPLVYVLPIREDIMQPLVYLVRRGVKDAIEARADLLVLDMDTNGGRVDKTEEIIDILNQFPGATVTFVNRRAFSAGAFISFATRKIYMAPEAVIGAAAPILLSPGGGAQAMPETVEAKMTSAVAAMVRASAEKNGHNVEVAEAMVRRTKELVIDGETLNKTGELLTLTSKAAEKRYGNPAKPLLSLGTFPSVEKLLEETGYRGARIVTVRPTGFERIGTWLSSQVVSSILLMIGIAGIYIEFKTPGFGLPGIVGITAFVLYFLGGYAAGLSGMGWLLVFLLGVALVAVEFFVLPGHLVTGLAGVALILLSVVMALVDAYPNPGRLLPALPGGIGEALLVPAQTLLLAFIGSAVVLLILSRVLPQTPVFRRLVSQGASGSRTDVRHAEARQSLLGREGVAASPLRPGGKARFDDRSVDVIARGEFIERGERVRVVDFSGADPIVDRVG